MFGGFGGEGTDQEGCRTQQVADLQYVKSGLGEMRDPSLTLEQLVRSLLRSKKLDTWFYDVMTTLPSKPNMG